MVEGFKTHSPNTVFLHLCFCLCVPIYFHSESLFIFRISNLSFPFRHFAIRSFHIFLSFISLSLFLCSSFSLSIFLFIYLTLSLSFSLSIFLSLYLSLSLSFFLSIFLFYLSFSRSLFLSFSLVHISSILMGIPSHKQALKQLLVFPKFFCNPNWVLNPFRHTLLLF